MESLWKEGGGHAHKRLARLASLTSSKRSSSPAAAALASSLCKVSSLMAVSQSSIRKSDRLSLRLVSNCASCLSHEVAVLFSRVAACWRACGVVHIAAVERSIRACHWPPAGCRPNNQLERATDRDLRDVHPERDDATAGLELLTQGHYVILRRWPHNRYSV